VARAQRDRRPLAISAVFALLLVIVLGLTDRPTSISCSSIVVASSNEKSALMTELAAEYSNSHRTMGCGPVVAVERVASGDAERMLAAGWPGSGRPDVWAPQASTWVLLLTHQLGVSNRSQIVPSAPWPALASSPLVVAMPRPMAVVLGWPAHQPGWKELLELAQNPTGWASRGQPQWGAFRLGKTDPGKSTSGMHALIAAYYAATGKSSDLTDSDVRSARSFVAAVEATVSHYADTADTFLRNLSAADDDGQALAYMSAVTIEEQQLWAYNQGAYRSPAVPPHVPLVAIYPSDGTLIADHPFVTLQATWVDREKRQLAGAFLEWLLLPAQKDRFTAAGFRNSLGQATGKLSTDPGVLSDKPARQLRLPSAAVLNSIQSSWQQIRKRVRLVLLLGVRSASALVSTADALSALSGDDTVEVWAVSPGGPTAGYRKVLASTSIGSGIGSIQQAVTASASSAAAGPLYSATQAAYSYVASTPDQARINAVVVISDGADDGSGPSLVDLERAVRPKPGGILVRIYAVAFPGSSASALQGIAVASDGVFSQGLPDVAVRQALTNT
jgi:Ca-activated chloride channel homolog